MSPSRNDATTARSMKTEIAVEDQESNSSQRDSTVDRLLPLSVLLVGFALRLIQAKQYFLNPDEALHYLLASEPSVGLAYKAALTNAHPPLLILMLYYWRALGHSELMLRMPSVLAGTACCWITYLWLKLITDRSTALTGLLLFSLAPSLVGLSAEIRQYALLLFFMSGCVYLSERAIREDSIAGMILFSLSLYGALLTHYSSLIFAFTLGVYMAVRLYPYGKRLRLVGVWAAGQVGGLALAAYYLVTHVARLKQSGMAQGIAETWLRKSIFHPGESHVAAFVAAQTLRVFTYLLSHGVGGTLALAAFLIGMVSLLNQPSSETRPSPRELALLLALPFVVNCGVALAGLYPYGGTRHNAFLALFGLSGAAIGLAAWKPTRTWIRPLVIFICLALCNLFPAPPPQIKAKNHGRILMKEAADLLRQSAPTGSVLFADYQSGLLLGYYVCGHGVVQTFPPLQSFTRSECGRFTVITARPQEWKFYASDLPDQLASAARTYALAPGTKLWLFDAGWITDSAPALRKQSGQLGCSAPQTFGENILLCQITIGGKM
jgi:Dolichyl-phosphate-mannose-protein mannosyltransferase